MTDPIHLRPLPTDPVDLAALKHWHQGSVIVDHNNEPLVVYHSTYVRSDNNGNVVLGDIHQFDRSASATVVRRAESFDTIGSWFSSNPGRGGAEEYGNTIYPVYLRITRPKHYETFQEFLDDFNAANGKPASNRGLGSAKPLREALKAQGYDGICLSRTNNAELRSEYTAAADAVRRAKEEYWSAPQFEREIYEAKVKRLEETLARLRAELDAAGQSTEFDNQLAMIAFEPEQIKSALGSDRVYDPDSPYLCSLTAIEQSQKIERFCQEARNLMQQQEHVKHLHAEFIRLGSLSAFITHFSERLGQLSGQAASIEQSWLENAFSNGLSPLDAISSRLIALGDDLSLAAVNRALNESAPFTREFSGGQHQTCDFLDDSQGQPVLGDPGAGSPVLQALISAAPPPKKPNSGREHEMEMGM